MYYRRERETGEGKVHPITGALSYVEMQTQNREKMAENKKKRFVESMRSRRGCANKSCFCCKLKKEASSSSLHSESSCTGKYHVVGMYVVCTYLQWKGEEEEEGGGWRGCFACFALTFVIVSD